MSDWIQSNWYELGSLLVQCAMLAILAWFGHKLVGLFSIGRNGNESTQARVTVPESQLQPAPALAHAGREEKAPKYFRIPAPRIDLIGWLQEPMGKGVGVAPWRRIIKWLQAPMGS